MLTLVVLFLLGLCVSMIIIGTVLIRAIIIFIETPEKERWEQDQFSDW